MASCWRAELSPSIKMFVRYKKTRAWRQFDAGFIRGKSFFISGTHTRHKHQSGKWLISQPRVRFLVINKNGRYLLINHARTAHSAIADM